MDLCLRARWRVRLVVASFLAASVAAAAPPPDPIASDASPAIRDAVRAVWARNPAVQAAEARLDAAHAQAEAAGRPLYNPDLDLNAENADVNTRSVGLSQTIDWSGKRRAHETAATAQTRAAAAERDEVRQRVAVEWLRGFAGYQVASEQVAIGAERVSLLEQFAALAERRFRVGDIPVLERDLAVLALQEARAQQAELVAEQAKARQALMSAGGRVDALPPLPTELPPSPDASHATSALSALPALRRAQAETEAAQARVTVAERDRRPDPTISLTGGRVNNGPFHDRLIGVAVKIPLFVRNSYSAEVTAARSSAEAAEATQRDLVLRANAEVEQAASTYGALRDAWLAWQESRAPSASERAALLQKLWEAGEISAADYLVQLKQSVDTELTAIGLRARVWQAWADWLGASGELAPWLGITDDLPTTARDLPQ
jgi:cobalt-zinc-cadmium efflux system outer membrane protein